MSVTKLHKYCIKKIIIVTKLFDNESDTLALFFQNHPTKLILWLPEAS